MIVFYLLNDSRYLFVEISAFLFLTLCARHKKKEFRMRCKKQSVREYTCIQPAKTKRCFTLIELLVVIGIIGILAGVLIPTLMVTKNKARESLCVNNLKQLALANILYHTTYKQFVGFRNGTHPNGGTAWNSGQWWFGYRETSSDNWDISRSPLFPFLGKQGKILDCPQAKLEPMEGGTGMNGGIGGYGYNSYGVGSQAYFIGYSSDNQTECWDKGGLKASQIANPSSTVMFADTANLKWGTTTLQAKAEITSPYSIYNVPVDKLKCKKPAGSQMYGTIHFRHVGDTANIAWVDGHVSGKQLSFSWAWGGADDQTRKDLKLGMFGEKDNSAVDPWGDDIPDTL